MLPATNIARLVELGGEVTRHDVVVTQELPTGK